MFNVCGVLTTDERVSQEITAGNSSEAAKWRTRRCRDLSSDDEGRVVRRVDTGNR